MKGRIRRVVREFMMTHGRNSPNHNPTNSLKAEDFRINTRALSVLFGIPEADVVTLVNDMEGDGTVETIGVGSSPYSTYSVEQIHTPAASIPSQIN